MDLDSMKYAELRNRAKQLGLKANMKADRLLKAIKKHYEQNKETENDKVEEMEAKVTAEVQTDQSQEVFCSSSVFVNTRRGKAKKTRTRDSDAKLDNEGSSDVVPQVRVYKKRRLSSLSKTEKRGENEPVIASSDMSVQVQSEPKDGGGHVPSVAKPGKIPRYKGRQVKRAALKPVTPNFQKLHEAHFNKMESIDAYVQRKNTNKRKMEPVPELKAAKASRVSLFSPAPYRNKSPQTTGKPDPPSKLTEKKQDSVFKPSVLCTRRINVRFSELMPDNEYKRSLVKTPARYSSAAATSTPKTQTSAASFLFSGNTSVTPGTQKKPVFDLKASLSRPLTYKPHTGKLKPFSDCNDDKAADKAADKSLVADSRKKYYKQHKVQTREERQAKQAEERKAKKSNLLFARRGLVMT
ncbi:nucleolar and spindle-associated protein 1 [Hippocampus zosterae]|uniref:nucleolar and spindle-associated protein 1 n=1 Tax=Hippocampus zosterae TaxID=109293 RepID=UPI00223DF9D7|nr:nucleolar and spindle-associated protein 1 [Hippocampus zosterae]